MDVKRIGFLAALAFGLAAPSGPAMANLGCAGPANAQQLEADLLQWINEQRADQGLRPLARSGKLDRAAQFQACDMSTRDYFAHKRPGGPVLMQRITQAGYRMKEAHENLAYTRQAAASSAASVWRNSPVHWQAIIHPGMRDVGLSVVQGNGKIYWVMEAAKAR